MTSNKINTVDVVAGLLSIRKVTDEMITSANNDENKHPADELVTDITAWIKYNYEDLFEYLDFESSLMDKLELFWVHGYNAGRTEFGKDALDLRVIQRGIDYFDLSKLIDWIKEEERSCYVIYERLCDYWDEAHGSGFCIAEDEEGSH